MSQDFPAIVNQSKLRTKIKAHGIVVHRYAERGGKNGERQEFWKTKARLGSGSYGTVWLQHRLNDGQPLALTGVRAVKSIPISKNDRIDWIRELETIIEFSHPNCEVFFVKSLGWYQSKTDIFIAMEYLEHGDLQAYLERSPALPESETNDICKQLLSGLHYMHSRHFTHRDLKPSNIMIVSKPPSDNWWIKIGDFGLSKRIEATLRADSGVRGTPRYMAPELIQAWRRCLDLPETKPADIWSLGAIMFILITQRAVFESIAQIEEYIDGDQELPVELLQEFDCSSDGISFFESLMALEPEQRLTAEKALAHSWMAATQVGGSEESSEVDSDFSDAEGLHLYMEVLDTAGAIEPSASLEWTKLNPTIKHTSHNLPLPPTIEDATDMDPLSPFMKQVLGTSDPLLREMTLKTLTVKRGPASSTTTRQSKVKVEAALLHYPTESEFQDCEQKEVPLYQKYLVNEFDIPKYQSDTLGKESDSERRFPVQLSTRLGLGNPIISAPGLILDSSKTKPETLLETKTSNSIPTRTSYMADKNGFVFRLSGPKRLSRRVAIETYDFLVFTVRKAFTKIADFGSIEDFKPAVIVNALHAVSEDLHRIGDRSINRPRYKKWQTQRFIKTRPGFTRIDGDAYKQPSLEYQQGSEIISDSSDTWSEENGAEDQDNEEEEEADSEKKSDVMTLPAMSNSDSASEENGVEDQYNKEEEEADSENEADEMTSPAMSSSDTTSDDNSSRPGGSFRRYQNRPSLHNFKFTKGAKGKPYVSSYPVYSRSPKPASMSGKSPNFSAISPTPDDAQAYKRASAGLTTPTVWHDGYEAKNMTPAQRYWQEFQGQRETKFGSNLFENRAPVAPSNYRPTTPTFSKYPVYSSPLSSPWSDSNIPSLPTKDYSPRIPGENDVPLHRSRDKLHLSIDLSDTDTDTMCRANDSDNSDADADDGGRSQPLGDRPLYTRYQPLYNGPKIPTMGSINRFDIPGEQRNYENLDQEVPHPHAEHFFSMGTSPSPSQAGRLFGKIKPSNLRSGKNGKKTVRFEDPLDDPLKDPFEYHENIVSKGINDGKSPTAKMIPFYAALWKLENSPEYIDCLNRSPTGICRAAGYCALHELVFVTNDELKAQNKIWRKGCLECQDAGARNKVFQYFRWKLLTNPTKPECIWFYEVPDEVDVVGEVKYKFTDIPKEHCVFLGNR